MMKSESMSRREMLRGTLAAGCALLLPNALTGCDSKQGMPSTDPGPATGADSAPPASPTTNSPAPSTDAGAPPATGKASKAAVQYQTSPKGEQKCADCLHFQAGSNTCEVVDGEISPSGWCTQWVKKV